MDTPRAGFELSADADLQHSASLLLHLPPDAPRTRTRGTPDMIPPRCLFEAHSDGPALGPGIHLGRGWHPGDVGLVWSRRPQAELVVAAAQFPAPVPLRLRLRVLDADPDRPRYVQSISPGHAPVTIRVTITATVVLRLHSPARLGLSQDARMLGLCLEKI